LTKMIAQFGGAEEAKTLLEATITRLKEKHNALLQGLDDTAEGGGKTWQQSLTGTPHFSPSRYFNITIYRCSYGVGKTEN
jgi:hypothetical protein